MDQKVPGSGPVRNLRFQASKLVTVVRIIQQLQPELCFLCLTPPRKNLNNVLRGPACQAS